MSLSPPRAPHSHRVRRSRRHAGAAAATGRRAVRRPPLLSRAGGIRPAALACAALAALLALGVLAHAGALTRLWDFLDYGAGVLALVSLTSAVLWGLAATDRVFLTSGHRLIAQGVHRGLAVGGLGFLVLHIWIKVAEARAGLLDVLVPFSGGDRPFLIGLGSLAGYFFVSVAVSGAVRSAFATKGRSSWWRALHLGAYPAWGAALVHGLKSGRSAAGWVTAAYALCILAVAALLLVRLRARLRAERARPAAAQAPSADRAPGQGRQSVKDRFVRRPAEWAAELLTARLARQAAGPGPAAVAGVGLGMSAGAGSGAGTGAGPRPAAGRPDLLTAPFADPFADPFAGPSAGPPAGRPAGPPPAGAPAAPPSAPAWIVAPERPVHPTVPDRLPYGAESPFVTSRLDAVTRRPDGAPEPPARPEGGARERSWRA
ncbi:hypothetical protein [Streptomyces sp. NPDC089799]|uniref:hypothetical protein n=1 Tax=Streptomyces sp. NPDC089799 TaxID=3155066 RepID=UPI00341F8E74